MRNLAVVGHLTIDSIRSPSIELTDVGGPPCYAGLIAIKLGVRVTAITRAGGDLPDRYLRWLSHKGLIFSSNFLAKEKPTTRFKIEQSADQRHLVLVSKCDPIHPLDIQSSNADGVLVSPIVGELSTELFEHCVRGCNLVFVDPQGFLRTFGPDGSCSLRALDPKLFGGAEFIKVDAEEAKLLTGMENLRHALGDLMCMGFLGVLGTMGSGELLFRNQESLARIRIGEPTEAVDTTGAGDILAGAFMATYLNTGDALLSACTGAAAASLSVKGAGSAKIPRKLSVERLAAKLARNVEILA